MNAKVSQMGFLCMVVIVLTCISSLLAGNPFTHRLVWANTGMRSQTIDTCIARMRAAASHGYNGYVVRNPQDNYLENVSARYEADAKRAVSEAKKLGIALIPIHFVQGNTPYEGLQYAEAFPVRNTKFVVENGKAHSVQDHETGFKNGDFEMHAGGKPDGWGLIGMPGAAIDKNVYKSGTVSLRISGGGAYARIKQQITLKPFRAYRLSVWVRTNGFKHWEQARFEVHGSSQELLMKQARPFGTPRDEINKGEWTTLSPRQGWRLCQTDFNSLRSTSATLQFLVTSSRGDSKQAGTIWLDNMKLEEVGLFETVRRRACPIVVKSADGSKTFVEGKDYIVDPKCDIFTWEDFWYQGHLQIPEKSPISEGQELRVSWYQMSDVERIEPEGNFCLPEYRDALIENVQNIDKMYEHNKWMYFGANEWRTAFWDDRCELMPKAQTAGEYLAGALKIASNIAWKANPCRELYIWSDMWDVYHNAYFPYYKMTNGGCQYSWKDMDTNIIIINWNACKPKWKEKSLRFYMGLDDSLNPEGKVYRQILSVMDGGGVSSWLSMAEKAEKDGGRGVLGISYVNWGTDFSQMGPIKNVCVARGRWGSGPLPGTSCSVEIAHHVGPKSQPSKMSITPQFDKCYSISYSLEKNATVDLVVTDIQGRQVGTPIGGKRKMGTHRVSWNASALSAGVYFVKLSVDGAPRNVFKHIIL